MPTVQETPALLTVAEACAVLRVSRPTLYRMLRDGRLLGVPLGEGPSPRLRVAAASVTRFVRERAEARLEQRFDQ